MLECYLLLLLQFKAHGINTVSFAAFFCGAVVKNVAQMGAAFLASYFGAVHPAAVIGNKFHILQIGRLGEARPAGAGIKFSIGREKLIATHGALVHPFVVSIPVLASKGRLRASTPSYLV